MYKLYGRNTCTFGIVAEFSVPAAGSQSNPYFNVNKWGISFISLSLSSNNKTEKSPLHFQRLVRSWDWARTSPWVHIPPAPPRMEKTKHKKRGLITLPSRNVKNLSLRCPFSWQGRSGKCTGRAAGHLQDKPWKAPLNARVLSSLVLTPTFLLIRLLKLDYEP